MKLFEFTTDDLMTGYYDPTEDKYNMRAAYKTRMPVLTLKHLNRLKKMRAVQKLEKLKRQELLSVMYAQPDEQGGGMPSF